MLMLAISCNRVESIIVYVRHLSHVSIQTSQYNQPQTSDVNKISSEDERVVFFISDILLLQYHHIFLELGIFLLFGWRSNHTNLTRDQNIIILTREVCSCLVDCVKSPLIDLIHLIIDTEVEPSPIQNHHHTSILLS